MSSYNDDYPLLGQKNQEPKVGMLRREEEYPNLSSSELLSNEEQEQLFQLIGMFEGVEPSAIITVIRSTKCNMEEAIDKLLDMTCTSPLSSISNSFENSNSLAHSQIQEDQFDNSTFTNSKIEEIPCESNMSESATDLESSKVFALDDYTFVENPAYGVDSSQQTFEMEEDFENVSSKSSVTDPEEGWFFGDRNSWKSFDSTSEYEFDGEFQSETQNEAPVFETESWPAPLSLSLPKMEIDSLIDIKSNVDKNAQADDSFLSVENNLFQDALERYQEKKEKKDELRRRLVRSSSLTLSNEVGIASETIDPLFDSIPKEIHEQKIAQLQKEKEKVVEEKRVAMIWCIQHITDTQKESDEKEKIIQQQRQEIERLQNLLKEREEKENKLEHLLMSGKGAIVEGAQTLQKNISDGISKMEKELKGQDVLEKMKEFLSELRQEISSAFRSRSNSKVKEEKENEEEEKEDEDLKLAQQASLISFEEETRWREKEKEEEEMVRRLSLSEGDF